MSQYENLPKVPERKPRQTVTPKPGLPTPNSIPCDVCKNVSKPAKCKCVVCDQWMCSDCEVAHKGIKLLKDHEIKSLETISKAAWSSVEGTIASLEKERVGLKSGYDNIQQQIESLSKTREKQLSTIDMHITKMKLALDDHHQHLSSLINEGSNSLVQQLTTSKEIYLKSEKEIQSQINNLKEKMKNQDIAILTSSKPKELDKRTKEDIASIKSHLPNISQLQSSPMNIEVKGNWSPETEIWVDIPQEYMFSHIVVEDTSYVECEPSGKTSQESAEPTYAEIKPIEGVNPGRKTMAHRNSLWEFCYEKDIYLVYKHDQIIQRISIVGNRLWCIANDVIFIYDKDLIKIKELRFKNISKYCSVVALDSKRVVLACDEKGGLHQLDLSGTYQSQVVKGSFIDVCSSMNQIYALGHQYIPNKQSNILVTQIVGNKWSVVDRFPLLYKVFDRVCINKGNLFVSSSASKCVYMYNLEGKYPKVIGSYTNGNPYLCGVDVNGNVLVVDSSKNSIQFYEAARDYHSHDVIMRKPVPNPIDVVFDENSRNMWVITAKKGLIKYSVHDQKIK